MTRLALRITLAALAVTTACRSAESAPAAETAAGHGTAALEADPAVAAALRGLPLYDLGSSWITQRGDSLGLRDLSGRIRVMALVYTSCHGTCPLIVAEMKRVEAAIPPGRARDVGFVLVSLDPARDTPGRLAQWATDNHLDQDRWTLLNGSDGTVRELAATLGVRYQMQPDGEVAHANVITVLDADGIVMHQQTTLGENAIVTSAVVNRLLP
ncbi:MAG: SCO family protein [Gemmatimonadaceae bacterium]|nr:SCO family protein [Gemmatimonadaceae bacterium]